MRESFSGVWRRVIPLAVLLPFSAIAQRVDLHLTTAESLAVSASLNELARDSVQAYRRAFDQATATLAAPIVFTPGSTGLTERMVKLIKTKAWYMYFNPELRVRLRSHPDTGLVARKANAQARARADTVRAHFRDAGIDLERISVDETSSGTAALEQPGTVTFSFSGLIAVVDIPPSTAAPPAMSTVTAALSPTGRLRFKYGTVRIFYATDRAPTRNLRVDDFYGGDRSATGSLEFGRIEVSVPRLHREGVVERPVWYKLERSTDPDKHMMVRSIQPLGGRTVFDSLRNTIAQSEGKEALVFIHGYNVTFHDAALRTAQLTYDLGFDGAPILYSWPSKGEPYGYFADRESAEWSADHLRVFLDSIIAVTGARHVHVIAHSMGNLTLTSALSKMATPGRDTILNNVVLAAADVDAVIFDQQIAPAIHPLMRRLTIYMSGKDRALFLSRMLSTHLRLGEATDPMLVVRGADTIDATAVSADWLGHGYVASAKDMIDDLILLLKTTRGPPRGQLQSMQAGGQRYWRFP